MKKWGFWIAAGLILLFLWLDGARADMLPDLIRQGQDRGYLPPWLTMRDYIWTRNVNGRTYFCIQDYEGKGRWITYTDTKKLYAVMRTMTWQFSPKVPLTTADYNACGWMP